MDSYEHNQTPCKFKKPYRCIPFSKSRNSDQQSGDKIVMPVSSLNELINNKIPYPWLFQISNYYNPVKVSHCGVLEFTAVEGFVMLPDWMMENFGFQDGETLMLESVCLPSGKYIKLQPHKTKFIGLEDPKDVLEKHLSKFSCLSIGDTIMIPHNGEDFYINVLETKPGNGICMIGTDCEVDFAPPLDYREPKKRETVVEVKKEAVVDQEPPVFRPFTGKARRLDSGKVDRSEIRDECVPSAPGGSGGVGVSATTGGGGGHGGRKSEKLVLASNGVKRSSDRELKDGVKVEETKVEKFQAFTGKKHVLGLNKRKKTCKGSLSS